MMKKRSKFFLATAVTLVLVTSIVPRGVYGIKNISLVREAEAQESGGAGGIMQSLLPLLMMMMMMNMMNKGQGPGVGKVGEAQKAATKNLDNAGSQSNGGGNSGAQPSVPNPLTPGGINIVIPLS
jgi:hypothetical protein